MATAIIPVRVPCEYERNRELFRAILTGAAAIDHTITPASPFRLVKVELHLSAAPAASENFAVSLDAGDGATYDVVLLSEDLSVNSVTDLVWNCDKDDVFEADDVIKIVWTNTNTKTYGLRIEYELI